MTIEGARRVLEGNNALPDTAPLQCRPGSDPDFVQTFRNELLSLRRLLAGQ